MIRERGIIEEVVTRAFGGTDYDLRARGGKGSCPRRAIYERDGHEYYDFCTRERGHEGEHHFPHLTETP